MSTPPNTPPNTSPPDAPEPADAPDLPDEQTSSEGPAPGDDAPHSELRAFLQDYRWGLGTIGALGLLLVVLVVGLSLTAAPSSGPSAGEAPGPATSRGGGPLGSVSHSTGPAKVGTENLLPGGGAAFSDGEGMVVGEDVTPGAYRQDPGSGPEDSTCFYVIYSGTGESQILRTGAEDRGIAVLEEGAMIDSVDCGDWLPLEETYPEEPATEFDTGMYVVGEHVAPGTYELSWDQETMFCWWDLFIDLRGQGHAAESGFVPQDDPEFGEPLQIILDEQDHLVANSESCGTWRLVE